MKWEFRSDYLGISIEEKPQVEANGTTYYEVDTSRFYIWYNGTWYEQH